MGDFPINIHMFMIVVYSPTSNYAIFANRFLTAFKVFFTDYAVTKAHTFRKHTELTILRDFIIKRSGRYLRIEIQIFAFTG